MTRVSNYDSFVMPIYKVQEFFFHARRILKTCVFSFSVESHPIKFHNFSFKFDYGITFLYIPSSISSIQKDPINIKPPYISSNVNFKKMSKVYFILCKIFQKKCRAKQKNYSVSQRRIFFYICGVVFPLQMQEI